MWWKAFKGYAFESYGVVVTDKEAEHTRDVYFKTYPELVGWHERQRNEVRSTKMVKTPTGRIRHLPDIDSPDKDLRSSDERKAINTPVQSFGSDMTILAMILINQTIKKNFKGKADIVGQVHDAILIECDEDVKMEVAKMVKWAMEGVPQILKRYFFVDLDVPIVADVTLGEAWGKGVEVEF